VTLMEIWSLTATQRAEQRAGNPMSTAPSTAFGWNGANGSVSNGTLERS